MSRQIHPDSHELNDWPLYGPRDPEIARLVVHLAEQQQMRLADIEAIMLAALNRQLTASGSSSGIAADSDDYQLGHNLTAQQDLLVEAYETGDNDRIEQALMRVVTIRRMKTSGTLDWQNPESEI